ncbi:SGNH/GDSL hydrolase family protein, partial [bacterium]|nr:SGNH/GDSL hydrolase family protein [bacterium]
IVYALMPRAAELPEATAPATFLALAGMAHVMAIRRHDAFRAPNLAIGAMIVISLAGVEWAHVAPGGSAEPMREGGVSFLPGTRYLGKVIPAGFLDGMATPWYVELGRIRPGPPPYEKPGGTVRVIALGSSSTEGWGIDDYRRVWPALLEAHLRKAYATRAIDVLNAGAAGSTTFRMMLNLKHELVRFAPDLVVLYAGNNDATIAFGPYTDRDLFELAQEVGVEPRMLVQIDPRISMENTGRRPVDAATRLRARLSRLALYRAMRSAVVDVRELAVSTENRDSMQVRAVPPDEVFPILLQMLKACQKHAADFVIVAEATHNLSIEPYPTLMEAFAERHGVPFFRAADAMGACAPDAGELFQDEVHLTHAGNVCLARAVADFLVARGLPNSAAARISAASRASPVPTR